MSKNTNNEILSRISELRVSWDQTKKTQVQSIPDGDGEYITLYWDEYDCRWTIEPLAFKGYVIINLLDKIDFYNILTQRDL